MGNRGKNSRKDQKPAQQGYQQCCQPCIPQCPAVSNQMEPVCGYITYVPCGQCSAMEYTEQQKTKQSKASRFAKLQALGLDLDVHGGINFRFKPNFKFLGMAQTGQSHGVHSNVFDISSNSSLGCSRPCLPHQPPSSIGVATSDFFTNNQFFSLPRTSYHPSPTMGSSAFIDAWPSQSVSMPLPPMPSMSSDYIAHCMSMNIPPPSISIPHPLMSMPPSSMQMPSMGSIPSEFHNTAQTINIPPPPHSQRPTEVIMLPPIDLNSTFSHHAGNIPLTSEHQQSNMGRGFLSSRVEPCITHQLDSGFGSSGFLPGTSAGISYNIPPSVGKGVFHTKPMCQCIPMAYF